VSPGAARRRALVRGALTLALLGCQGASSGKGVVVGAGTAAGAGTAESAAEVERAAPAGSAAPASATTLASPGSDVAIVSWPLRWSARRAALTLAYRRSHDTADVADLQIAPRVIVLHYTGGGSARGTKEYFDAITIENGRAQLARAGRVNVSAHFLVDRDGTIYQLQPETRFARHCIGLNHVAIGVENVGDERRWPLTEQQVLANAALVRALAQRHPITHLLGHHEVMAFRQHPYFREREPAYRNRKTDPGPRFVAAVRAQVADLGLAGREGDVEAAPPAGAPRAAAQP
jgi:N-acetylmuramoyl-L-alanine amidase